MQRQPSQVTPWHKVLHCIGQTVHRNLIKVKDTMHATIMRHWVRFHPEHWSGTYTHPLRRFEVVQSALDSSVSVSMFYISTVQSNAPYCMYVPRCTMSTCPQLDCSSLWDSTPQLQPNPDVSGIGVGAHLSPQK